jgi:hypothetical protein
MVTGQSQPGSRKLVKDAAVERCLIGGIRNRLREYISRVAYKSLLELRIRAALVQRLSTRGRAGPRQLAQRSWVVAA